MTLVYQYDESHITQYMISKYSYLCQNKPTESNNTMIPRYLGVTGFAEYVGLKNGTIQSYLAKGILPEPDIYYIMRGGRRPAWSIDTIEHWIDNRPGKGHTYKSMKENN